MAVRACLTGWLMGALLVVGFVWCWWVGWLVHGWWWCSEPGSVQNTFRWSGERHYRQVCELLRCRDSDFISFITGLLQVG